MTDDLTDTQIALLCEIGEPQPSGLSSDQKRNSTGLSPAVLWNRRRAVPERRSRLRPRRLSFLASGGWGRMRRELPDGSFSPCDDRIVLKA